MKEDSASYNTNFEHLYQSSEEVKVQHDGNNHGEQRKTVQRTITDNPIKPKKNKRHNQTFDARIIQSTSIERDSFNPSDYNTNQDQQKLLQNATSTQNPMRMQEFKIQRKQKVQSDCSSLAHDAKIISQELELEPSPNVVIQATNAQQKKTKIAKLNKRDLAGSVILNKHEQDLKNFEGQKYKSEKGALKLNLVGMSGGSQEENSPANLPAINSTDDFSRRSRSPRKITSLAQHLQLSNIRSVEEDESPVMRERKAMDQFAASISASQESKSPTRRSKIGKLSHLSVNMKNIQVANGSDLPLIDLNKVHSLDQQRSPILENKLKKLSSPMGSLDEVRVSRNQTLMQVNKTSSKKTSDQRTSGTHKKTSTHFQGLTVKLQPTQDHMDIVEKCDAQSAGCEVETPNRRILRVNQEITKESSNVDQLLLEVSRLHDAAYASSDGQVNQNNQDADEDKTSDKSLEDFRKKYKSRIDLQSSIAEPLPLLQAGIRSEEPEPVWKRQRLRNYVVQKLTKAEIEEQKEKEEFELKQRLNNIERQKADEKLNRIQQHFKTNAANIKVESRLGINLEDYPQYFKYKIYECFKPLDLKQTRNYIQFLTNNGHIPGGSTNHEDDLSPELYNYLSKEMPTILPNYINQKRLLQFDTMFESGNLDSAYMVNETEYNLLCKTDTNTKGNTYWFYFKVLNWTPKASATFNLLNVARDLHPFYSRGMQIWTRTESSNGRFKSDWQCSNNGVNVIQFQQNDIERSKSKKKEYACGRNYNTLKFKCQFPEIQTLKTNGNADLWPNMSADENEEVGPNDLGAPGTVFCFAYSLPYTFSDLISDLENSKKFLLSHGGIVVNELNQLQQQKPAATKRMISKRDTDQSVNAKNSTQPSIKRKREGEERAKLTKNELEARAMMKHAINTANNRMGQLELQLIKADEGKEPLIRQKDTMRGCKLLEIHTDYLYYKQERISQSIGGLDVYQLTLTKRKGQNCVPYHRKKCMYITARMHAAETYGSLVMKYIIQELVMRAENYDSILSNYIIKLVPLINTDGVTIGNSRSSLVGLDLNRRWAQPNSSIHPEIYFLKLQMQQQADSSQGISIYCDLHGHNRKENCFFYGCNKAVGEGMLSWTKTRLLPKIFASTEQIFDFSSCRFKQEKESYRSNTARVVVWNEMKVTNSFTLETSQFGKTAIFKEQNPSNVASSIQTLEDKSKLCYVQFQFTDMQSIAKSFLVSTAQYQKLEKEVDGWFKLTKLNEITGETKREKQNREANQKKSIKDQRKDKEVENKGAGGARKRLEKMSSSVGVSEQVTKRRIGKVNSNHKVTESNNKGPGGKDSMLPLERKPATKRQQSQINVNHLVGFGFGGDREPKGSATKKDKKGPSSVIDEDLSAEKLKEKEKSKTQKKPKGPKIIAITAQEDTNQAETTTLGKVVPLPVVTKLRSWKQFFDMEDLAKIKKLKKAPKENESSDDSDSECSVDNFTKEELQEQFGAALDHEDADPDELNPFEKLEESESDDNDQSQAAAGIVIAPTGVDSDENNSVDYGLKKDEDSVSEEDAQPVQSIPETPLSAQSNTQCQNVGNRYLRDTSYIRGAQMQQYVDPDLTSMMMNQLILESKAQQMKASAAPPSGSCTQPQSQPTNQQEMNQGHILRGYSFTNPARQFNQHLPHAQPLPSSSDQYQQDTMYFTNQPRRMVNRNANQQFTVLGQGVSTLNTSSFQLNEIQVNTQRKAPRKQNSMIKGLTPLPMQQLQQMNEDNNRQAHGDKVRIGKAHDCKQFRQNDRVGQRNQNFSESRQAARNNRNQVANIGIQSLQQSHKHGIKLDSSRIDQSQDLNSQRQQQQYGTGSVGNSQTKLKQNMRQSRDQMKNQKDSRGHSDAQYRTQDSVRIDSNHPQKALIQNMMNKNQTRKYGHESLPVSQLKREITPYDKGNESQNQMAISQLNKTADGRAQVLKDRLPDTGRYSSIRKTTDQQNLANTLAAIKQSPHHTHGLLSDQQNIHQFAYSPLPSHDQSKRPYNQENGQLQTPSYGGKKSSFSTPRNNRTQPRPNQFKQIVEGIPISQGSGVVESQHPQSLQFGTNVIQTGYSGSHNLESSYSRAMSYDRKYSNISSSIQNSTMNQTGFMNVRNNIMNHPNGFEIRKGVQQKNSRLGRVTNENSAEKQYDYRQPMIHVDHLGIAANNELTSDQISRGSVTVGGTSSASQRVTPAIGVKGLVKDVKIRKGRNIAQARPNQQEIPELFIKSKLDEDFPQFLHSGNTMQSVTTQNALLNQIARDLPSTPNQNRSQGKKQIRNTSLPNQQDQR